MESTTEIVCKEENKSSVSSKKYAKEVSTTSVQKLSSHSLVGEYNTITIMGSDGGLIGGSQLKAMTPIESSLSLSLPIVTSPSLPEDGNTINTSSLMSEFSAMELKDEHGNKISAMVQQKEQQQSVQASSSVPCINGDSISISKSVGKELSTTVVAEALETVSSVSSSSFSSTKKQEIVSSSTRSLSSIKSLQSQSIEKVVMTSTAAVEE